MDFFDFSLFVLIAAGGGSEPSKPAAETKAAAAAPEKPAPAPAAAAALDLPALGLKIDAPAGTSAKEMAGMVMISGGGLTMNVKVGADGDPKTVDEAKRDSGAPTPLNFKDETVADGWLLTFEAEGSMGKSYWLIGRREIGGKVVFGRTTVPMVEKRDVAVAAFNTLRQ